MNRKPLHTDESWENDAVWKLLDQSPPATASPRFADDTVRAARLLGQPVSIWKRIFAPIPLAGLAATTAAVVFSFSTWFATPAHEVTRTASPDAERAAEIQDIAEIETLIAAVDHLDQFSDHELVTLIGF
jgi:hypothetical protein